MQGREEGKIYKNVINISVLEDLSTEKIFLREYENISKLVSLATMGPITGRCKRVALTDFFWFLLIVVQVHGGVKIKTLSKQFIW